MNVKDTFMSFGSFKVKNGTPTQFWVDTWLGNQQLKDKFSELFNIVRSKQDSMAKVLSSIPLNISFCSNLVGRNLRDWHRIVASLHDVNLQGDRDIFVWALHSSGIFFHQIYVCCIG
jgi:hypothetical protein